MGYWFLWNLKKLGVTSVDSFQEAGVNCIYFASFKTLKLDFDLAKSKDLLYRTF